jgi:hypothetical protein
LLLASTAPAFADDGEDAPSKIPAYVATGVTAAFLVTATVSFLQYQAAIDGHKDKIAITQEERDAWNRAERDAQTARTRATYSIAATIVAGGITGYLWSRTERPRRRFTVTADGRGATAWLGGSF